MNDMKWKKPIEITQLDEITIPLESIVIHYTDQMSHYAVLWQIVKALAKNKFATEKEIREEWLTLLKSID